MAAVRLLLSSEPAKGEPLARFYPDLAEPTAPPTDAFPAFHQFCLAHAGAVAAIVGGRSVNTNEVGRCAVLRFGYAEIARMLPAARFAVVEVGASAGLNLFWDNYRYEYDYGPAGAAIVAGDPASPVRIGCAIRGSSRPPLRPDDPFAEQVARRVGPSSSRSVSTILTMWPGCGHWSGPNSGSGLRVSIMRSPLRERRGIA